MPWGGWLCGTAQCHQVAVLQSAAQGPPPGVYQRLTIPRAIGDIILEVEGHPVTEGKRTSPLQPGLGASVHCKQHIPAQIFLQPRLNFPTQQCRQVF